MIFKIKKNCHRSRWFPSFTFKYQLSFSFQFFGDISYEIERQGDTHKIYGLSDGWHHRKDSIRLGWRYYKEEYQLMAIIYNGGKRKITKLKTFNPNEKYACRIEIQKYVYIITVDDESWGFIKNSRWNWMRYKLFPYFGGKEKSTKEIKLEILWNV